MDSNEREILGVTAAAYTESSSDTPAANNKIEKTAQSGQNGVNLLSAGGAEIHDGFTPSSSNWAATSSASGYTAAINGTKVRNGSYALKTAISTSAADNVGSNKRAAIYQTVTLEAGKQLADALSISWSLLSKTETGNRDISIQLLCAVVNYFQVSADYILSGEDSQGDLREVRMRAIVEELNQLWLHK